MPRRARVVMDGVPLHIIQRGNNRAVTFFAEDDYLFYLEQLRELCVEHNIQLHAYCLMTNHVHLLVTPIVGSAVSSFEKGVRVKLMALSFILMQWMHNDFLTGIVLIN